MDRNTRPKKGKAAGVQKLRQKWKNENLALSKEKRSQLVDAKRIRPSPVSSPAHSGDGEELEEVTIEQVDAAIEKLLANDDTLSVLKLLVRAFAQGSLIIEHFLKKDTGAFDKLIGVLSGSDAALQLEAVWSITNMAAGDHEECLRIAKAAAPYMITYLSGDNKDLQEQCAWGLGNIAGDSAECRDLLMSQGVMKPLITLLESVDDGCRQNAAFALSNLARGGSEIRQQLLDAGILELLVKVLKSDDATDETVAEISWVLSYLTAAGHEVDDKMNECGAIDLMYDQLQAHSKDEDLNNNVLVTPVLRFLGNVFSGTDELTEATVSRHENTISLVSRFLSSNHRHVVKETLWVLSNLAADKKACELIVAADIIPQLVSTLSGSFDIKLEAAYTLYNITVHGNKDWCQALLDAGAVKALVAMLKSHDGENIHVTLSCFGNMLAVLECAPAFEEAGALSLIEPMEYHANEDIKTATNELLQKYFYKEVAAE